jgi:hypothetical protein
MADEREAMAARLRRIREAVRERSLDAPTLPEPLGAPRAPALEPVPTAGPPPAPEPPDAAEVNAGWQTSKAPATGLWARLVRRALKPFIDAQQAWNARQVQLDNRVLEYLNARFDATHGHYDRVLGLHGQRMQEIDERHLILQEELVQHVHDLVKRSDLVLAEAERGRLTLEAALKDLRRRIAVLEEKLPRG